MVAVVAGGCGSAAAGSWAGGLAEGPTWGVEWWEVGVASYDFAEHSWRTKVHKHRDILLLDVKSVGGGRALPPTKSYT